MSYKNPYHYPRPWTGNLSSRAYNLVPMGGRLGTIIKNHLSQVSFPCIFVLFLISLLGDCHTCQGGALSPKNFTAQHEQMVLQQIEGRGITNKKVLAALRKVKRHEFVPPAYQARAYEDSPLPIGDGQTISQPYIVAFMTEILALENTAKVLEIGTGSGYQAAILAELCREVYTIEIIERLGKAARLRLQRLGYTNIQVKLGDGYKGWQENSPYDAIIVTCAPTLIPPSLTEQLAEGGKMIIPVGETEEQHLVLLVKEKGLLVRKNVLPVRFVPMLKEDGHRY